MEFRQGDGKSQIRPRNGVGLLITVCAISQPWVLEPYSSTLRLYLMFSCFTSRKARSSLKHMLDPTKIGRPKQLTKTSTWPKQGEWWGRQNRIVEGQNQEETGMGWLDWFCKEIGFSGNRGNPNSFLGPNPPSWVNAALCQRYHYSISMVMSLVLTHQTRKGTLPAPEDESQGQNSPTGDSRYHIGVAALPCRELGNIGPLVTQLIPFDC